MLSIFSLSGRILQAPAYYKLESPRPKTATKIDLYWITVLLMSIPSDGTALVIIGSFEDCGETDDAMSYDIQRDNSF